ncbi:hypothetical protein ACTXT7_007439 [Hymenolepis weldensis]
MHHLLKHQKPEAKHPGFINTETACSNPPLEFNASDYSSLSGYPMKWCRESEKHLYECPSPTNRPFCAPASWIATCMLHHLEALRFHAIPYVRHKGHSKKVVCAHYIYPTISLINHSCNPSVSIVNIVSGGVFAYAIRSLRAGDEISIQYGPYFAERSSLKNRKDMQFLSDCAEMNEWFKKNAFKASALEKQFQALLPQPSRILSMVIQKYVDIIESAQEVSTSDPLSLINQ